MNAKRMVGKEYPYTATKVWQLAKMAKLSKTGKPDGTMMRQL
jgi:hypothetical protein